MAASLRDEAGALLERLGVRPAQFTGGARAVTSPIDGQVIGEVHDTTPAEVLATIEAAQAAFLVWRSVP
ncbi:MAG TPA: aldehyde dehydrogenase family protein, partial [Caulobacteraceae bacterium]|nr:aldehyde dehydrogenase family protein [Caulobacteraceae bacterium]